MIIKEHKAIYSKGLQFNAASNCCQNSTRKPSLLLYDMQEGCRGLHFSN